jgi:hypothetical protein
MRLLHSSISTSAIVQSQHLPTFNWDRGTDPITKAAQGQVVHAARGSMKE